MFHIGDYITRIACKRTLCIIKGYEETPTAKFYKTQVLDLDIEGETYFDKDWYCSVEKEVVERRYRLSTKEEIASYKELGDA